MCDLEAYRASLRPHSHEWEPLTGIHDWCRCGATRQRPDDVDD